MPIEIRELHIKMSVSAGAGGAGGAAPSAGEPGPDARRAADDELVARCVEHVMDLLRYRTER